MIAFRARQSSDAEFLRLLFEEARQVEFAGLEETIRAQILALQFQAREQSYQGEFPDAVDLILTIGGRRVGRLLFRECKTGFLLIDLAVSAAERRKGIGSAALAILLDRAACTNKPVSLSVRSDNQAARLLYERLGFRVTGDDGPALRLTRAQVIRYPA